jgi:hypothetical protein
MVCGLLPLKLPCDYHDKFYPDNSEVSVTCSFNGLFNLRVRG